MSKYHNAKIGTIPGYRVRFRYAYKLRPGLRVVFQEEGKHHKWETGILDRMVGERLFISRF